MTGGQPPYHPMPGPPPGWTPTGQPPPSGAPPWPPYSPPPRRRRSRWLTVGLPLGLVLLLGGCGVAVAALVTSIGSSIQPAQDAATAYAKALVDQRWADAQVLLCSQDRAVTPDQLAAHYANPRPTGYAVQGVNVTNMNGRVSAVATLRLDTADGLSNTTTLPLIKEGDTWHPCP
jgi:hypothetical protein